MGLHDAKYRVSPRQGETFRVVSFWFRRSAAVLFGRNRYPRLTPWATDLLPLRGCQDSPSLSSVSLVTLTVSPSTVPSTLTCRPFFDFVFFKRSAALALPLSSNL